MAIFRVLGPKHIPHPDENATDPDTGESKPEFVRGEYVDSQFDLDDMFEGSFDRMDGKLAKTHRDRDHMLDRGGTTQVMDLPRATKAKMMKTAEAKKARGEDEGTTTTARPKFNRDPRKRTKGLEPTPGDDKELVDEEDDNYPANRMQDEDNEELGLQEESDFGEDVTKDFPSATAGKFKVFKDEDDRFTVVNRKKPDEPLHEDALATEEDVETFMEEQTAKQPKPKAKTSAKAKKGGKRK